MDSLYSLEPLDSLVYASAFLAGIGGVWHYFFKNKGWGYRLASFSVVFILLFVTWLKIPETYHTWKNIFRLLMLLYIPTLLPFITYWLGLHVAMKRTSLEIKQLRDDLAAARTACQTSQEKVAALLLDENSLAPIRHLARRLRETK
jgi:hypothetical protein